MVSNFITSSWIVKVPFWTCGVFNFKKFEEGKLLLLSSWNLLHTMRNLKKIMWYLDPICFIIAGWSEETVHYKLLIARARKQHITWDRCRGQTDTDNPAEYGYIRNWIVPLGMKQIVFWTMRYPFKTLRNRKNQFPVPFYPLRDT